MYENPIELAIRELHKGYDLINTHIFDDGLPKITLLIQTHGRKKSYGWASVAKIWSDLDGQDKRYEITITAEYLHRSILEIMATLIHECVHIYNSEHGVKDTSRGLTYHNKKFKEEAERRGLIIDHDEKIGWSITHLQPGTQDLIESWSINSEALNLARAGKKVSGGEDGKKKSGSIKWTCICKTIIRSTKEINVICGDCKATFKREDKEEDKEVGDE